jgi:6-pyruvoyltetrahydropterin/6-carboxytetrahydropterin synthase
MSLKECQIIRRIEIDMGHRVPAHKSKCKNLHGHRYAFEIAVIGPISEAAGTSSEGMVLDFADLKSILVQEIEEKLDHGFMMYEKDSFAEVFRGLKDQKIIFVPFIPTAENIAAYVYNNLKSKLDVIKLALSYVKVWETPNCSAIYPSNDRTN